MEAAQHIFGVIGHCILDAVVKIATL